MSRYSEAVMDHFQYPRNEGRFESPDRVGVAGVPGCGRYVVLQLLLLGDQIEQARFQSHGCGATIASASVLTELIIGRSVDRCGQLAASDILAAVGGLPADKAHCEDFALSALQEALRSNGESAVAVVQGGTN